MSNSSHAPGLFVPDRYDTIRNKVSLESLEGIIEPIDEAIDHIRILHRDMRASGRGAFLILRGDSGSGKSTFLNTLHLFIEDTEVMTIERQVDIGEFLGGLLITKHAMRICVLEGRDAVKLVTDAQLEAAIHDINSFIRTKEGENTLVVWPANTVDLEHKLVAIADQVGADSLLGTNRPSLAFSGPPPEKFIEIANKTIALLNQGAGLYDLGISVSRANDLLEGVSTMGKYLGLIRQELLKNQSHVETLVRKDRCRLWILVAASNEPEGEVDALTRGIYSSGDIERLLDATEANIVADLKKAPEKLGILGTVLDVRIFHLPVLAALAAARDHHDPKLLSEMKNEKLATAASGDSKDRMTATALGKALTGSAMGLKSPGGKIGSNTEEAFKKLVNIATSKDELVNIAVAKALVAAGLITSFKTEQDFGTGLTRTTDIVCEHTSGQIRLEVMWRTRVSRAAIANYTLTKVYNYGRAVGLL